MTLSTELGNLFSKEGVSENEKRQEFLKRSMETVNAPDEDSSPINYLPSSNFSRLTPRQREEERKEQQATTTYKTPKLPIGPATLQASSTKGRRRVVDFAEVPNFGDDGKFSGVRKVPVGVSSKGKKVSVKDIPLLSGQTGVGSLNIKGFGTLEDKKTKIDLEGNIKKRVSAQARELGFKGSLGDLEFDYSNLKEGKKGNKKETTHSTNLGYTLNQGDKGKFNVSVGAVIPTGSGQEPTYKGRFGYTKTFREGGIVDMRDGGKVGAAVVAASLMASGGQAMDMRDGGVVGMEQGGTLDKIQSWFTPDNEEAAINLVDATEPDTYQIKHMTGLSLDIFNKSYDRLIKSDLVDPGQRQQALENFDKFTQDVFKIESSENWTASHPAGASGGFQFKPDTIQPTINRLERLIKDRPLGSWTKDILKHKEASRLSPEQQRALFVTNMFERSLRDKKGKILKGEGDKLLIGTMKGDTGDMVDAYYKLHYAGDPDWKTRFRANTMLRFEKEGEDRIFNFAKQIKKLLN